MFATSQSLPDLCPLHRLCSLPVKARTAGVRQAQTILDVELVLVFAEHSSIEERGQCSQEFAQPRPLAVACC